MLFSVWTTWLRTMRLQYDGGTMQLHTLSEDQISQIDSDFIELCTFQNFASEVKHVYEAEASGAFVACVMLEPRCATADQIPGTDVPRVHEILNEFSDV